MRKCLTALMLCCLLPAAFCPAQEAGSGGDQLDFANGLFSRGFFEEAAEEYEVFLQANPSGPEAPNAWFRLGQCAQASGSAEKASAAKVRVLIESTDGTDTWTTVGVSTDIIAASWKALTDSIEYLLNKKEREAV